MDVVNSAAGGNNPPMARAKARGNSMKRHSEPAARRWVSTTVNGDGLTDVVTAVAAHGWGLAMVRTEARRAEEHLVGSPQHHGRLFDEECRWSDLLRTPRRSFADMDGDGVPDFITGKRLYSHLDSHLDPDPYAPRSSIGTRPCATRKPKAAPSSCRELINNRSGVGSQFVVTDLNGDGAPDVRHRLRQRHLHLLESDAARSIKN